MGITTVQLEKMLRKRNYFAFSHKRRCQFLTISPHAYERWGERVGELPETIGVLQKQINTLYDQGRIQLNEYIGRIDGDIVFTYEQKDEAEIYITTFYGRITTTPALSDWRNLRRYNEQTNERLNLTLSENELKEQPLVVPADNIIKAKIERKKYTVETFHTEDKGIVYVLTTKHGDNVYSFLLENWDEVNYPILKDEKILSKKEV